MTARGRGTTYSRTVVAGAVLVWCLLCFVVLLSPRLRTTRKVSEDLAQSSKELRGVKREIEDAGIIGGPPVGGSRFDKFGILAEDEEQLFLTDLIRFCEDTGNVLNLVRRSEHSQRAVSSTEQAQGGAGARGQTAKQSGSQQPPKAVVERVPHIVTFSGTFLSTFYLLRRLESYKRLLTVERVDIVTDGRAGYPRLNGSISIDLYLAKTQIAKRGAAQATQGPAVSGGGGPQPAAGELPAEGSRPATRGEATESQGLARPAGQGTGT